MTEPKIGPPTAGLTEVDVEGTVSLYADGADQVLLLNETATDVWVLCDGELTATEIVNLLASAYGTDPQSISADVLRILADFVAAGVIPEPGQVLAP